MSLREIELQQQLERRDAHINLLEKKLNEVDESIEIQSITNGANIAFGGGDSSFASTTHNVRNDQCAENAKDDNHDHDFNKGKSVLFLHYCTS